MNARVDTKAATSGGVRRWGINIKFMLFILLAAVCFLVAIFFISRRMLRDFSLQAADELAETILERTDKQINQIFDNFESLSRGLAGTRAVKSADPEGMRDLFIATVLGWKRYIRAIYLGTADGRMYEWGHGPEFADHVPTFPPGYDPRQRPWYKSALESEGFTISPPYVYASVDALGITCVLKVYSDRGEFVGVLGIDILLENLKTILEDFRIPKQGRALLLSETGEVIAGQFENEGVDKTTLRRFEAPALDDHLQKFSGSFNMDFGGQATHFVFRRNIPIGWFVLIGIPHRTIMRPVTWLLTLVTIIDLLLMGMLTIAISLITNKLIASPLREIVSVINRFESGDRTARVRIRSGDEFGVLGAELNKLVETVEEYSTSLEAKVRDRTEELWKLQQENTRLKIIEERKRIYRDMHDSLGAKLTNIFFCNGVARRIAGNEPEKTAELLDGIEMNCLEAVKNLKDIIWGMKEDEKITDNFSAFLQAGIRQRLQPRGMEFSCRISPRDLVNGLPQDIKSELGRVFDELVSNVLKHSEARRVSLSLTVSEDEIKVRFKDDGSGFTAEDAGFSGAGLSNIRFRIEYMRGKILIISRPGKGTEFRINIPRGINPAEEAL
jgi:signal transduction histidine kinase